MDTDGPENRTKAASKARNWDILHKYRVSLLIISIYQVPALRFPQSPS
jgi:hypothetical protein